MKILRKIKERIPAQFFIAGLIALAISVISSLVTYHTFSKRAPRFAVVDLAYLHNDFIINLARYLDDNKISEDQISEVIKSFSANLESLLNEAKENNNYVLLQKQTVASEGLPDVTKEIEKVLFEKAMVDVQRLVSAQEESPKHFAINKEGN